MQRSFTEASKNQRDFGAIAIDATGAIAWGKTSQVLLAAYHDGKQIGDTLDMDKGMQVLTA
jgi:L-asparaginase